MNTFEITIQRKLGDNWPIVIEYTRSGILLPLRSEGTLKLNQEDFGHLISLQLQPQNYGTVLGKALFQDEIRDAFIAAIRESQESLRVLLFIEAVDKELRILRWERLCVPIDNSWSLLALNQRVPFSLYIPATTDRRFPPIGKRDLRALILVASPSDSKKYNLAEFDVEATVKSVKSALGEIPTDVLATVEGAIDLPTLDELIKHLNDRTKQYTILHFVSHGRMNKDSETLLYWSKADNTVEVVTATRLLEQLSRLRGARGLPHFTFLSTCESASPEAEAGLGGFGQRLVRDLGMPAVVAMTEKVTIKTAQALAENFYRKLQESGEVDSALQEASATLAERQDITVPVLFSRLGGRPLFSDQLDRDLTNAEISYGLVRLNKLLEERSPLLLSKLQDQKRKLAPTLEADTTALTKQANQERSQALEEVNNLSQEVLDLSFNNLALGKQPPIYDSRCPFRGLYPFKVENHEFFFGREALIAQLEQQLTKHKFLAIFGASGSGKSSVVLAGLIPFLQKKQPGLEMVYLTPSSNPVQQLEASLPQLQNQTSIIVIDQFEELFTLCTDQALRLEFIQKFLLLVKEQLVVITMRADFWGECASYPELKELMQSRQELIGPMDSTELRKAMEMQAIQVGLRFEAGLSNSILDDVQGEPGAMPLLQHALLELWKRRHGKWLRSDEYEAIGGVTRAIAQTADDFYNKLSEEQQEQIKNIFVRLTRLDETAKPGEKRRDTRRRVWLEELIPLDSNQEMTKNLLKQLAGEGARLVVTSVDAATNREEVEVAHEALIRYWPRLLNWLDENRSLLEQRETIRKSALEWEEQQKEENYLEHRGERLEKAQALLKQANFLNQLEANYVKSCVKFRDRLQQEKAIARRREVRKNWAIASGIVVTVVTTSLGVIAWTKGYEAEINKADSLSKNSLFLSEKHQSLKALIEGVKAAKIIKKQKKLALINTLLTGKNVTHNEGSEENIIQSQIIAALRKALNGAQERNRLIGHKSSVQYLEFIKGESSNDTTLITRSNDKNFKLWNLKTGQELKIRPLDHPEEFTDGAISNDGKNLAFVAQDKTIQLWDSKTRKPGKKFLTQHKKKVNSIDFSPNGKTLASASEDKTVKLWDLEGKPLQTLEHQGAVKSIDFSPDGKTLLSTSIDKNSKLTFKLWNLKGKLLQTYQSDVTDMKFSPDGQLLLSVSEDNKNFKLWDLKGKLLQTYESDVTEVLFSPGGKHLVSVNSVYEDNKSPKKTFKLWNLEGQPLKTYESDVTDVVFSPDDQLLVSVKENKNSSKSTFELWNSEDKSQHTYESDVTKVIFSPDSSTLASANTDKTVSLWDLKGNKLETFKGHQADVTNIGFSPDGSTLASASKDNSVILWNLGGKLLQTFTGHEATVTSVIFSPDGNTLASASKDNTVKVWNLGGKLVNTFTGHKYAVTSVVFAPQSDPKLISASEDSLQFWDLSGKTPPTFKEHQPGVTSIAFAGQHNGKANKPNCNIFATASKDNTVQLWNLNGNKLQTLRGHKYAVNSVVFAPQDEAKKPDCKNLILASGSEDKIVKLWDLNGNVLKNFSGHQAAVTSVAFSPDGKTLASGSEDNTIKLWDLNSKKSQTFKGHRAAVTSIAFSPDGKTLASASKDNTVQLWDLNGNKLQTFKGHQAAVTSITFSPDGKTLVSASDDKTFKIWSLKKLHTLTGHKDTVNKVVFSPDGQTLATASDDQTVQLWDAKGNFLRSLSNNFGNVKWVVFSPDGKTLASASDFGIVKLWDLKDKPRKTLDTYQYFTSLVFSPDGKTLAFANKDDKKYTVQLLNLEEKQSKPRPVIKDHEKAFTSLVFSPDGTTLASGSKDNTVKLLNLKTQEIKTLKKHEAAVTTVVFSPDGKTLASGSQDSSVILWDLDGKPLHKLPENINPDSKTSNSDIDKEKDAITSVVFSSDGKTLASGSEDKTIKLWGLDGKLLKTLTGHKAVVTSVIFSPNGKNLASASEDNTIKIWNLSGKEAITLIGHEAVVKSIAFSPDGYTLASASADNKVMLWDLNGLDMDAILNDVMVSACDWARDYINNSQEVEKSDKRLCDRIETTN